MTSGGTAYWQELALFIVANYAGVEQAGRVAKVWALGDEKASGIQYLAPTRGLPHSDAVVQDAQVWAGDNYMSEHPVQVMISRSGLPTATFARRFKKATGISPQDFVLSVRIEEAKQMLETSEASIDEIGVAVGYDDSASFRRSFKRRSGTTPSQHRRMYGAQRFRRYRKGA